MEEVGLRVNSVSPVYLTNRIGESEGFFQGNTVFGVCYVSSDWGGEVVLSSEHTEYQWVTPAEFATLNFGSDSGFFAEAISNYSKNSNYSNN